MKFLNLPVRATIRRRLLLRAFASTLLLQAGIAGARAVSKDWPDLGVVRDSLGMAKTLILEGRFRGLVRSIQVGDFDGDSHLELAMLPQTGVYLLDATTLKAKSTLEFQTPEGKTLWSGLAPYMIASAGSFRVAILGGGFGGVGLLDNQFKPLWNFRPNPLLPPDAMVVDDAQPGQPRFYVCDNGMLYRLDERGQTVWKVRADGARLLTLVRDAEGQEVTLATAHAGSRSLSLWSANGKKRGTITLPLAPYALSFVRSGDVSGFVARSANQLVLVDRDGRPRFRYSYRDVPVQHGPTAVLLRLEAGQPPVLAVRMQSSSATSRSVLSLFALDGVLLYQEYLKGGLALGLVAVPGEQRDRLLLGDGADKLWAYELAATSTGLQTGAAPTAAVEKPQAP
jgi:hypothetical protein